MGRSVSLWLLLIFCFDSFAARFSTFVVLFVSTFVAHHFEWSISVVAFEIIAIFKKKKKASLKKSILGVPKVDLKSIFEFKKSI